MSYHLDDIKKGELGEISKIKEEFQEYYDSKNQNCKIMEICELSDVYGAIIHYIKNKRNLNNIEEFISFLIDENNEQHSEDQEVFHYYFSLIQNLHFYPNISVEDLKRMSEITERAFKSGRRQ